MNPDLAMARYGTLQNREEERRVRAGPWSALLVEGALREIRYRDVEVIRSVAFVVRDKDWGTCRPLTTSGVEIDEDENAFRVGYRAQCANPDGHLLSYALSIVCTDDGTLTFNASVSAHDAFLTARCGFCVLHPIDGVAGAPARVEHGDGTLEQSAFPQLIDPWQPFKDISAIEHDLACGLTVRCAFTGDVFEMEDQRNWSDASFKTYSRPLELPWPYTLEADTTQRQSVTLKIEERSGGFAANAFAPGVAKEEAATITLDITEQAIETMPALGIAIAPDEIDSALAHPGLLAELAPQQLNFSFYPAAGHGLHELEQFAALQRRSAIAAVLEYALPGVDEPRRELDALAAMVEEARLDIEGIVVSPSVHRQSNPPGSISPPCPALDDVYRAARSAFPELSIGGGMLSYFTELNRKRPPLELVDWVTHATCPIVHAADDRSVMQTLEAIAHITRSCRALIGEQPYAIGPISIGMRQNPYGSRVMPNPRGERVAMAGFDPRQTALFGAAWLVGYAAALQGARIDTLTLGALTGERGLADVSDGAKRYPMYAMARALAAMAGCDRLAVTATVRSPIACVAARDAQGRVRVLITNLSDYAREVRVSLQGDSGAFDAVVLDEENLLELDAMSHPERIDLSRGVVLRPYACLSATATLAFT